MRNSYFRKHIFALKAAAVVFVILSAGMHISAINRNPVILIINSYHQGFRWTDELTNTMNPIITGAYPDAELFIENMDVKRIDPGGKYLGNLGKTLHEKYSGKRIDLVICTDNAALDFMATNHHFLFTETPVIFCGVNDFHIDMLKGDRLITGIVENPDITGTVNLAIATIPYLRKIIVISDDTDTGKMNLKAVKKISEKLSGIIDFDFSCNGASITMRTLLNYISIAPPDSAVLYLDFFRDETGRYYSHEEWLPVICKISAVPVFTHNDSYFGFGPVGGSMNLGSGHGEKTGLVALKILGGTNPEDIPIDIASPTRKAFDYRQMKRHRISYSRIPKGSHIYFRENDFFERYKKHIWFFTAIVCFLLISTISLIINTSRRNSAEKELRKSQENLNITLQSIGDAVISTDINGNIVRMNPKAEELTGWTFSTAGSKPLKNIFKIISALSGKEVENPVFAAIRSGKTVETDANTVMISKDGREIHIADSASPICNSEGITEGAVLVFRDITEKYRIDEQLRHSQKMDVIGQLAGGMAHDFNNMLVGIIGAVELINMSIDETSPLREYTEIILNSAKKSSDLTNKLLAFSRKGKTVSCRSDLHRIIDDAISILERSIDKKIQIHRNYQASASSINGDPVLLQNSFLNLGINARDAMPYGGILDFSTRNCFLDENFCRMEESPVTPGNYIEVTVTDSGSGIKKEDISRIFEPFFTTKPVGRGTGLGLSAVYGTVREHRGIINVKSEPEHGTVITINLPVDISGETKHSVENVKEITPGSGTILLVDDEPYVLSMTGKSLSKTGYTVLTAENGLQAIDVYRKNMEKIDLVIIDMVMPELSGRETFEELKKISQNIKVIFSSGFNREGNTDLLIKSGACGFIQKPYMISELSFKISRILGVS